MISIKLGGLGLPSTCEARNTTARKSTRGTSLHTAGGTTFPEARLRLNHSLERLSLMDEFFEHTHTRKEDKTQWVDEHSRKTKAEQEWQDAIEAGVTDPPPVSEETIWIETVGGKRRGRVYGMGEVRDSSMVRPRVDGPTTTTSTNVWILENESQYSIGKLNNMLMDQFSHQLSSLTEYVRAMGPSSSGSRVPPPPPFTFPSS
ncbi:hypothetical protein DS421_15g501110 [Arachis hypogaea]|uniref:Uncharacterized protein n=1 Tax=Arachis hypogaea TaxID=3818 RepID=A0A444Z5W8_ARAHY|nr:hypothetical protein DS421_15g501110 [Arachis hypogaea]RYR09565.1 hypothetical protein Ahy_B05g077931 [Arachis hypogaea]